MKLSSINKKSIKKCFVRISVNELCSAPKTVVDTITEITYMFKNKKQIFMGLGFIFVDKKKCPQVLTHTIRIIS